jgi:hypothetical protein
MLREAPALGVGIPAAVTRRRRSNVLLIAILVLLMSLADDIRVLPNDGARGQDFNDFYAAALAQSRGLNPYSEAVITKVETQTFGHASFSNTVANPPALFVVLRPFTLFSAQTGYLVWLVLSVLALIFAIRTAVIAMAVPKSPIVWMLALSPPVVICLFLGQLNTLLLAIFVAGIVAIRSDRPWVAGLFLAITLVKPHVMIVPIVLICGLCWRGYGKTAMVATAVWAGAITVLAVPFAEPGSLEHWIHALVDYGGRFDRWQPDISSLAGVYTPYVSRGEGRILSGLAMLGGVLTVASLLRFGWRRRVVQSDSRWWLILMLGLAVWLVVLPYEHPYDEVLLLPALFLIVREVGASFWRGLSLLAIVSMLALPELDLMGFRPNFTFSYTVIPVIATAAYLALALLMSDPPVEEPECQVAPSSRVTSTRRI